MSEDRLLLFLEHAPYSQEQGAWPFDTTLVAKLIDADVGHPATANGQSLEGAEAPRLIDEVLETSDPHLQTGTAFREQYCVTDPDRFTRDVKLTTGETVTVDSYDVIFVSHIWFMNYYIAWLTEEYPDLTVIGIQEESPQDVLSFSPALKSRHLECLRSFDGYVTFTEEFDQWVGEIVSPTRHIPLPVPEAHFHGVVPPDDREGIIVGVGTWNLDYSNFYTGSLAVAGLVDRGFDVEGEIIGIKDWQESHVISNDRIDYRGFLNDGFYEYLAGFELAILPTMRSTAGRISAELAGVGVPCIGNRHNDLQRRCWPELSIHPLDTSSAVELAVELLTDEEFYDDCVEQARTELAALQRHDSFERVLEGLIQDAKQ
ncbi:MAG: hypothetical protein ABEI98_12400 [Halorhabdus sp.]